MARPIRAQRGAMLLQRKRKIKKNTHSAVARSSAGAGMAQARVLTAMTQEINRGYQDVMNRRPVGHGSYSYPSPPPSSSVRNGAVRSGRPRLEDPVINDTLT